MSTPDSYQGGAADAAVSEGAAGSASPEGAAVCDGAVAPQAAQDAAATDEPAPDGADWAARRREAAAERARLLAARQDAEHARAGRIVSLFLRVARQEGLEPVPLRVRGYGGGSARTGLRGWYLRADQTVGIDTEGRFYTLTARLGALDRLRGYTPSPEPVPMTIGEGGRDGDIVPLRFALDRLLPGWEERSPEPLT